MTAPRRPAGFTLIELIAMLLIIGILAGVATPRLLKGASGADLEATISHLRTIALAAELFYNENGRWPDGDVPGVMPPDFDGYLRPNLFATPCPIGGVYDWDENFNDIAASVLIRDADHDVGVWSELDALMDDGVLSTGRVTKMSTKRLRVVVEY